MTKLDALSMLDILPQSIKDDKDIEALSKAIDTQMQQVTKEIAATILLPRIDELSEDIVDFLAWQFHVDFYEPLGLDLDKKRSLVKNSISWHRRKGTKSVLEEMLQILFLKDFELEEWYEYGGEPYFFRLNTKDRIESEQKYNEMIRAIYELKNTRSWLESFKVTKDVDYNLYYGNLSEQKIHSIVGFMPKQDSSHNKAMYYGTLTQQSTHSIVDFTPREITNYSSSMLYGNILKHTIKTHIGMDICAIS